MLWVKDLWENKRWLFWLLLPVVIIVVVVQGLQRYNVERAKEFIKDTIKKDNKLKDTIKTTEIESTRLETRIEETNKRIDERRDEDVSLTWHERFEDD